MATRMQTIIRQMALPEIMKTSSIPLLLVAKMVSKKNNADIIDQTINGFFAEDFG